MQLALVFLAKPSCFGDRAPCGRYFGLFSALTPGQQAFGDRPNLSNRRPAGKSTPIYKEKFTVLTSGYGVFP